MVSACGADGVAEHDRMTAITMRTTIVKSVPPPSFRHTSRSCSSVLEQVFRHRNPNAIMHPTMATRMAISNRICVLLFAAAIKVRWFYEVDGSRDVCRVIHGKSKDSVQEAGRQMRQAALRGAGDLHLDDVRLGCRFELYEGRTGAYGA